MKNSRLAMVALCALLIVPGSALAREDLCESAARVAARETGVPAEVLLAISLTETGRRVDGRLRPWPWAVNREGQGYWFDTRAQALAFARRSLAEGRRSFDLGCFQINWRWHGENFDNPEDLLEPVVAARYAARLLLALREELGDWTRAAGAYHSRTPRHAQRYSARFARILASLDPRASAASAPVPAPVSAPVPPPAVAARQDAARPENSYILLTGRARGASLVPLAPGQPRPFIAIEP